MHAESLPEPKFRLAWIWEKAHLLLCQWVSTSLKSRSLLAFDEGPR